MTTTVSYTTARDMIPPVVIPVQNKERVCTWVANWDSIVCARDLPAQPRAMVNLTFKGGDLQRLDGKPLDFLFLPFETVAVVLGVLQLQIQNLLIKSSVTFMGCIMTSIRFCTSYLSRQALSETPVGPMPAS